VAGWSAGANVAAVVCQLARDAGGPRISGQLLLTPVTVGDMATASYRDNADGDVLTAPLMKWFWDHYADPAQRHQPKAAPLRDEGVAYARAMAAAGEPVRAQMADALRGFFKPAPPA